MWVQFTEAIDNGNRELALQIFKELRGEEKIRAKKWLFGSSNKKNKNKKIKRGKNTFESYSDEDF